MTAAKKCRHHESHVRPTKERSVEMTHLNPLLCERCGAELESDDAVSVIEGVCCPCRTGEPRSVQDPIAFSTRDDPWPDEPAADPPVDPVADSWTHNEPQETIRPPDVPTLPSTDPPSPSIRRARRRARDLGIGVSVGLILTASVTTYLLTRGGEQELPAIRQTPLARSVTLRIDPPTAVVKLDGKTLDPAADTGKWTVRLSGEEEAPHWLEISAAGYHADRRSISMLKGVDDVFIELLPKPYEATIRTDPPQAEVWINDELKGYSPLTLSLLPREPARLRVEHCGYSEVVEMLSPTTDGSPLVLDLALEALGPVLRVVTNPPGAKVTVDGELRGIAPVTLRFDADHLGRGVHVVAASPGYDDASTTATLPTVGAADGTTVRLTLQQTFAELEIRTVPPGGRVIVDGKNMGAAPVVARFKPTETGRSIVVQASRAGAHYGRQDLIVPPPGDPISVTIPMTFNAQRVVFLLSFPPGCRADARLLADQAVELIHLLTPKQRFSVLARTDEGIEAWPGGLGTHAATSEQKVRAFDKVRSVRLAGTGDVYEMMEASLGFKPTTIWLFAAGRLDSRELERFGNLTEGRDVSVHIVTAESTDRDHWLERWAAGRNGTLTVLGQPRPSPAVALDDQDAQ